MQNWFDKMRETLGYLKNNPVHLLFFFLLATLIANTSNLMGLFTPIIAETFAVTDFNIGILQFVITFMGIFWTAVAKRVIDREKQREFEWYYLVVGFALTYGLGYLLQTLYYIFFRPASGFSLILFIGYILVRQVRTISGKFTSMNFYSIMLKIFPSEFRNSVWLVFFSMRSIVGIVLVFIATNIFTVDQSDISNVLILVSVINIGIALLIGLLYKLKIKEQVAKGEFYAIN